MSFKDFYQFAAPTRVIAGRELIGSAGFEFAKEGAERVLLVTDQVIRGTGLPEKVEAGVADGGLEVAGVFDDVPQDSDTAVVMRCAEQAKDQGADSFLAVGGGSVIDTTKAANVIFSHGGTVPDWEGVFGLPRERDGMGKPLPLAPLGVVPTTAGTGSEASPVAVIKDSERGIKFVILDFPVAPDLAILDPESTATLPAPIAAATGMDALTHAIEGVTSTEWSPHGGRLRAPGDPADPRQPGARGGRHLGRGGAGQHAGRREPGDRARPASARPASPTRCRIPAGPATAFRTGSPTRSTCRR